MTRGATVAYPGRDGAHAATACDRLFVEPAKVLALPSFTAVAEATIAGEVEFGVLPIESTLVGPIAETEAIRKLTEDDGPVPYGITEARIGVLQTGRVNTTGSFGSRPSSSMKYTPGKRS